MRRQKIILVSEQKEKEQEKTSSWGAILGALTAMLTALSGILYLAGYLFLTGYYSTFSLPISLLGLSAQTVLAVSAVLLIPIVGIFVLPGLLMIGWSGSSFTGVTGLAELGKNKWFYLAIAAYLLVMVFTIPPTGRWFANKQIMGSFSGYRPLAEPLPFVSAEIKQPLPCLPSAQMSPNVTTATYKNLRLVASTDKYFFLYTTEWGTCMVPHDAVLWMGFSSEQKN